eukprot:SAG11_NODE_102_length_16709_cov_31.066093_17_plen_67_part_00
MIEQFPLPTISIFVRSVRFRFPIGVILNFSHPMENRYCALLVKLDRRSLTAVDNHVPRIYPDPVPV